MTAREEVSRRLDSEVYGQLSYLRNSRRLLGAKVDSLIDQIRPELRLFLQDNPLPKISKERAALHEAAHFVAMVVYGDGAWKASIRGSAFGHHGWSGDAFGYGDIWDTTRELTSERLIRQAKIHLSGVWAERLLGDFYGISVPGEILEGQLYSAQATKLDDISAKAHLVENLADLTAFLSMYKPEILKISEYLVKRKEITCFSPSIKKVIRSIREKPLSKNTNRTELCDRRIMKEFISSTLFKNFQAMLREI